MPAGDLLSKRAFAPTNRYNLLGRASCLAKTETAFDAAVTAILAAHLRLLGVQAIK